MGEVKRHALRRNDRTWTPHLVAFIDTEFPPHAGWSGPGQPFLCGGGIAAYRHGKGALRRRRTQFLTHNRVDLCDWIEEQSRGSVPLWLYAHSLTPDLQASGLLEHLLDGRWNLSRHALGNPHPWAILTRGDATVHLCDSMSLFMASERVMGDLLGLPKLTMPEPDAQLEDWLAYCWRDVEIGHAALMQMMDTWDRRNLGNWTETGPGCGWNNLRHTIQRKTVWIDPDPQARSFERAAIYAGRREALKVGQLPEPEYCDLDLERAHTTVAATVQLPYGRGRSFQSLPADHRGLLTPTVGAIAHCRIRTETPRYPLRLRRGIVHPVGEFWTVLAGPELAEAQRRGELLEVGPGYFYQLSCWAMPWAQWVNAMLAAQPCPEYPDCHDDEGPCFACAEYDRLCGDPLLKLMAKGWSKTVWGRSAMQVSGTTKEGDGPSQELHISRGRSVAEDCRMVILDHGWHRWTILQDQDWDDSFPAILAWIQSHVRVALGRLVDELGVEAVAQIASDGVLVAPWRLAEIVHDAGASIPRQGNTSDVAEAAAEVLSSSLEPQTVRLKDVLRKVALAGPDHLEAEDVHRLSGVPRSARRVGPWRYEGQVWPSLAQQTQLGSAGQVVIQPRTWDLSRVRPLRWVYSDGCAEPLRAAVWAIPKDAGHIGPPAQLCRHGSHLEASQHPALMAGRPPGFWTVMGVGPEGLKPKPLPLPGEPLTPAWARSRLG